MLLLSDQDVRRVLDIGLVIERVESAFAAHGRSEALRSGLTHTDSDGGEFHVKTGGLPEVFGAKVNGAFPSAPGSNHPSIRGIIALFDASEGTPLAIMDSGAITGARTGAATAVAAKYLARRDSAILTIAGCGAQGVTQLATLHNVLPLRSVFAWSRSPARAALFSERMAAQLGLEVHPIDNLAPASGQSDIIVTCTPSTKPIIGVEDVRPGTFVAAVGADSPGKQELAPELLARSRVVPDVLEQCLAVGELHHAVEGGFMRSEEVHAELGAVVAGLGPGRVDDEQVFVFDSTGTALQDVAAGIAVYEKALTEGIGSQFAFSPD